jgi:hypothetical protein
MSFPITAYAMFSAQPDVFTNVVAFAPLSRAPQERVSFRFGSQEGTALGDEVSGNFFSDLDVRACLGRTLSGWDETRSARVVVLSYDWWIRKFASDPAVIGETLYIKGLPFTVIGVACREFPGVDPYQTADFWIPLQRSRIFNPWGEFLKQGYSLYESPEWYCLLLIGRLQPRLTAQDSVAKLTPRGQRSVTTGGFVLFDAKKSRLYFSPAHSVEHWRSPEREKWMQQFRFHTFMTLLWGVQLPFFIWLLPRVE